MRDLETRVVQRGQLAEEAAAHIAAVLRAAVDARGRATVAFSGGSDAGELLAAVAETDIPWQAVDVFQVDERVAPDGHPDRNLNAIRQWLVDHAALPPDRLHAMPVEAPDLDEAALRYADVLHERAGQPPRIDLVHLGIGTDGHTASLIPGSPLLHVTTRSVAVTDPYHGRRRMTLTLPVLSGARSILWYVNGHEKAPITRRLVDGDRSIPASLVERSRALLLLDRAAASALTESAP